MSVNVILARWGFSKPSWKSSWLAEGKPSCRAEEETRSRSSELQKKLGHGLHVTVDHDLIHDNRGSGFVESTRPETFVVLEEHHRSSAAYAVVDANGNGQPPGRTVVESPGEHRPKRAGGPPRRTGLGWAVRIRSARAIAIARQLHSLILARRIRAGFDNSSWAWDRNCTYERWHL